MFTDLFESAVRARSLRNGPAGTLLEAFAQALVRDRYALITARRHLRAAEHFVHWRIARAFESRASSGRRWSDSFVTSGEPVNAHFGHTFQVEILHGARLFLTHLQDAGLIDTSTVSSPVVSPLLITEFRQWMNQHGDVN